MCLMGGWPSGKQEVVTAKRVQAGDCPVQSGVLASAICPCTPGTLGSWVDS